MMPSCWKFVNLSIYRLDCCFHTREKFYTCSSGEMFKNTSRCCVYDSPRQEAKPTFSGKGLDEYAVGNSCYGTLRFREN